MLGAFSPSSGLTQGTIISTIPRRRYPHGKLSCPENVTRSCCVTVRVSGTSQTSAQEGSVLHRLTGRAVRGRFPGGGGRLHRVAARGDCRSLPPDVAAPGPEGLEPGGHPGRQRRRHHQRQQAHPVAAGSPRRWHSGATNVTHWIAPPHDLRTEHNANFGH